MALAQGDHAAVRASLEESVAICRETEDKWALGLALRNLGIAAFRQDDHERAAALLGESLAAHWEEGGKLFTTLNLEFLAAAAVSMWGEHGRAARLFGAAEALREAVGASVLPSVRADSDRAVAAARDWLGEAAFTAAWSEGRSMTLERAVEYALETTETPEEPAPPPSYHTGLSAREVEVLRLVAQGMTNAQIAKELFISPRTVNAHMCSVYHKLGFGTRAEAARFAAEHGLL